MALQSHTSRKADYNPKNKIISQTPQDPHCPSLVLSKDNKVKKCLTSKLYILKLLLVALVIFTPYIANAGFFSDFSNLLAATAQSASLDTSMNSQNIPLLQAVLSPVATALAASTTSGLLIDNGDALDAESGPLTDDTDASSTIDTSSHQISLYIVHPGDTLSQIAQIYGVSVNTIVWANDLTSTTLKADQMLVILPISGVQHTVVKGDTLSSIAKQYKADSGDIAEFNGLDPAQALVIGTVLTIPDGELSTPAVSSSSGGAVVSKGSATSGVYLNAEGKYVSYGTGPTAPAHDTNGPNYDSYYIKPVIGVLTQGLHGYNAVDLGAPEGTVIWAAAAGTVIVSKMGGWNGGYGNYVVISHGNGTQTLYAHMEKTAVTQGQIVTQGQVIGYVGMTGEATGPHLHFEVRGAHNPFQ